MTEQEWKLRCLQRIERVVQKHGRIRTREVKRLTHYNRGPKDESVSIWLDAMEQLIANHRIVAERNEYGWEVFLMTPEAAKALASVTTHHCQTSDLESCS